LIREYERKIFQKYFLERVSLIAEIVIIGDEVLLGIVREENASYIIEELTKRGFIVRRVVIIGDNLDEIGAVIKDAFKRGAQLVITTGGLGPTEDDLTLDAVSKAFNIPLEVDQKCVERIKSFYGENVPKSAFQMARRLKGAKIYPSPLGLAPAQLIIMDKEKFLLILPGPPREVRTLLPRILDEIAKIIGRKVKCSIRFYVNAREAEITDILAEVIKKFGVYAKALVSLCQGGKLPIELVCFGENMEKCEEKLSIVKKYFCEKVRKIFNRKCLDEEF